MSLFKIVYVLCLVSLPSVYSEVFSSISVMEDLVTTQGKMLEMFDTYLNTQEQNLKRIKKRIAAIKSEYDKAVQNPEEYVSNPVNSFRIIKQLHVDWNGTIILMKEATEEFMDGLQQVQVSHSFPDADDLEGAVEAMLNLQFTYLLETKHVAEGVLNGVKCSSPLNSNDCFELGLEAYKQKSYHAAQEWFKIALDKFKPDEYVINNKTVIMEFLAYNKYNLGDVKSALKDMKDLYLIDPRFNRLTEHIQLFQNIINNETELNMIQVPVDPHTVSELPIYEKLCREALDRPLGIMKKLKCRYVSTRYPFTKIAPFKVEEHYFSPYVVVFHDIITDEEIEYLKNEVRSTLQRALVVKDDGDAAEKYRTSMNAWLDNDYSPIITRLNTRMQDMTGLVLDFAEEPQIANYGIGGYYAYHFDCSLNEEKSSLTTDPTGNRLATILIYMTDVEQGGNTVFPMLGISVRPKKGTAVFWYNLHPSGEANTGTLHAACPVFKGNKWVLNKWIRLKGNSEARPCNLEFQEEGDCTDYPALIETGLP